MGYPTGLAINRCVTSYGTARLTMANRLGTLNARWSDRMGGCMGRRGEKMRTSKRLRRISPGVIEKARQAARQLIHNEDIPADGRLEGIFLLMDANGLPCDMKQRETIRKRFDEFVADQRRRRKKP